MRARHESRTARVIALEQELQHAAGGEALVEPDVGENAAGEAEIADLPAHEQPAHHGEHKVLEYLLHRGGDIGTGGTGGPIEHEPAHGRVALEIAPDGALFVDTEMRRQGVGQQGFAGRGEPGQLALVAVDANCDIDLTRSITRRWRGRRKRGTE